MNQLAFRHSGFEDYYEVLVDGRLAMEILREQIPDAAGLLEGDMGVGIRYVTDVRQRRLVSAFSTAVLAPGFEGIVLLLTCGGCNVWGCSDHYIRASHADEKIVWDRYGDRPDRPNGPIGPFVFDPAQYRAAVEGVIQDNAARLPPREA